MEYDTDDCLLVKMPGQPRLKFYLSDKANYYRRLYTTTGSAEFIEAFESKYQIPETPASEEEIFSANKLEYIPAMLRETAGILDKAADKKIPILIQPSDIRGIIHSHSTWSDGVNNIEKMGK